MSVVNVVSGKDLRLCAAAAWQFFCNGRQLVATYKELREAGAANMSPEESARGQELTRRVMMYGPAALQAGEPQALEPLFGLNELALAIADRHTGRQLLETVVPDALKTQAARQLATGFDCPLTAEMIDRLSAADIQPEQSEQSRQQLPRNGPAGGPHRRSGGPGVY